MMEEVFRGNSSRVAVENKAKDFNGCGQDLKKTRKCKNNKILKKKKKLSGVWSDDGCCKLKGRGSDLEGSGSDMEAVGGWLSLVEVLAFSSISPYAVAVWNILCCSRVLPVAAFFNM